MARIRTPLSEQLGLTVPIVQAPMAGGPSSPELVAACSAAGALGSFGFAYTQPDEMKKQAAAVRAATGKPFGINLFGAPLPADIADGSQRDRSPPSPATTPRWACPLRSRFAPLTARISTLSWRPWLKFDLGCLQPT